MAYALASSNICTKWEHSETSINIVTKISNSKEKEERKVTLPLWEFFQIRERCEEAGSEWC